MSTSFPWDRKWVEGLAPDRFSLHAAHEVLLRKPFGEVEASTDGQRWIVSCRGLTGEYRVRVNRPGADTFVADCTCPSRKQPCKHVLALLLFLIENPDRRPGAVPVPAGPSRDFESLLRAVFHAPTDDLVRFVFADYLEETGQTGRADLIRVQCELARLGADAAWADALRAEERRLLDPILNPLLDLRLPGASIRFERGFARLDADVHFFYDIGAWPGRVASLFREGWVEAVALRYGNGQIEFGQVALPYLACVAEVDLRGIILSEARIFDLATVLPGPAEGRVRVVHVHPSNEALYRAYRERQPLEISQARLGVPQFRDMTAGQADALLRTGRLRGAGKLHLSGEVDDEAVTLLAGSADFAGVEDLTVPLGDEGIAALAEGTCLRELTHLRLTSANLGDAGLQALARSANFPRLEFLDLARTKVTAEGVAILLSAPGFSALKSLDLSHCPVESSRMLGLALTAFSRPELRLEWHGLTVRCALTAGRVALTVTGRDLPDVSTSLLPLPPMSDVVELALHGFRFNSDFVERLGESLPLRWLRLLDLSGNDLGDGEAAALADRFRDARPSTLNLADNLIGYRGAARLARSPLLSAVEVLVLSGNSLGAGGVDALASSPHLLKLRQLVLRGGNFTAKERKTFGERLRGRVVF